MCDCQHIAITFIPFVNSNKAISVQSILIRFNHSWDTLTRSSFAWDSNIRGPILLSHLHTLYWMVWCEQCDKYSVQKRNTGNGFDVAFTSFSTVDYMGCEWERSQRLRQQQHRVWRIIRDIYVSGKYIQILILWFCTAACVFFFLFLFLHSFHTLHFDFCLRICLSIRIWLFDIK